MENRTNGLSIGGMVIGIISLLISFIPCIGVFGGALALVGLILSLIGYRSAKDMGGPTGMGITGMVLSAIAILVALAWGTLMAKAGGDEEPLNVETCDEVLEEMEKTVKQINSVQNKEEEEAGLGDLTAVINATSRIIKIKAAATELGCDQDSTFNAKMSDLGDGM